MKIAITYENGQVFQHFGHTQEFKIYNIENNQIISSDVVSTDGQGHGTLAGFLAKQGVNALICGGIGGGAKMALANEGIEFYPGAFGDADTQAEAFVTGNLQYDPNTQCHHHEHAEGHACGDHGCGNHSCGNH